MLVLILLVFLLAFVGRKSEQSLRINVLDVGQGDAILIISPDNKKLLIDTGNDSEVVYELISSLGIFDFYLDYVLITHSDADHAGGLDEIMSTYRIGSVIRDASDNSDFYLGCCVLIDFVWPNYYISNPSKAENDDSAAFFLEYNDFKAFFGGDLSSEIEDQVATLKHLDVDFLKISHHGSETSTSNEFLSYLKPEIAVISVGKDNKYGHPDNDVLQRLEAMGIQVYRTDISGRLSFNY